MLEYILINLVSINNKISILERRPNVKSSKRFFSNIILIQQIFVHFGERIIIIYIYTFFLAKIENTIFQNILV